MRKSLGATLAIITLFFVGCKIQQSSYHPISKADLKYIKDNPVLYYEESMPYITSNYPEKGAKRMENILAVHPKFSPALQALGNYYVKKKQYRNALTRYKLLKKVDPNLFKTSYENYAIALAGNGQFITSSLYLDTFLNNPDFADFVRYKKKYEQFKKNVDFAIQYGKQLTKFMTVKGLKIKNMGASINTKNLEYTPSLSLNAKRIIFTRRALYGDEDLYQAKKNDSGVFMEATPIKELNTPMNEGSASLSSDNKKLLITYCDREDGFGKCDIYISYYAEEKGWTPPVNIGNKVNTEAWESQPQFGPNNNSIYFSSDRPGGLGGRDIWITYLNEQGQWENPINLGHTINTPKNEELPFMHSDNETLYFSSDGWQGYGSSDLFLAKRISDQQWEHLTNLGFPINTIDKEGGLIVEFGAKYAYFSSDKSDGNSQGSTDIYRYELPPPFRPKPSTWIQGKVVNAVTFEPIKAVVDITNLNTKRAIGKVITSRDGNFLTTLPIGEEYAFHIFKDGYFFHSSHIAVTQLNHKKTNTTFFLKPLSIGLTTKMNNIFFELNKSSLDKKSYLELNYLTDLMKKNIHMKIRIQGHTDSTGSETNNQQLSLARAESVKRYLITQGISPHRIKCQGFGSSKSVATNNTSKGRALNRRSEVIITEL